MSALADIDVNDMIDIGARQYSVEDKFCMVWLCLIIFCGKSKTTPKDAISLVV